ncbi:hypothetical protein Dda3937_04541 [Dickeya dadantii 3937]|uniref:Uncharacterized protein n=1 Tax=Dickeya dadantii (strain 3937) TaxID=198628 RepID=E0SL35_DICD3|nr:hypothetical protein Dda3937_04541 [Dickeya dadantii 3937]
MISSKRPSSRWLYIPLSYRTLRICCVNPGMQVWADGSASVVITRRTAGGGGENRGSRCQNRTGRPANYYDASIRNAYGSRCYE